MWLLKAAVEALVLVALAALAGTMTGAQAEQAVPPHGIGPGALVCYVADWSQVFEPRFIKPELCSVLLYSFVKLNGDGTLREQSFPGEPNKLSLAGIAAYKSATVVGLSVGGWAEGSERFSAMVTDPNKRTAFIKGVVRTVEQWDLGAVELAWIFTTAQGRGLTTDKDNYARLVQELGGALRALPGRNVSLGVALPVADGQLEHAHDLATLGKHADWLLLQGYDLHGHWHNFTGVNAPLYKNAYDNSSVTGWLEVLLKHVPPNRVILGMPAFGRTFMLEDSPVPGGLNARSVLEAIYSRDGMMHYNQICPHIQKGELSDEDGAWKRNWDEVSMTPYAATNAQTQRGFISYDDPPSIRLKVRLARDLGLAGVGLFTIDADDYEGICGQSYPLLTAAYQELHD